MKVTSRTVPLSICAFACALVGLGAPYVATASQLPIVGWAWSDNSDTQEMMGWISFSSANAGAGGGSYGVYEDSVTGALSGYAWSDNLGWVTFNASEVSGCPSGVCAPDVNLSTGSVTGWARACSAFTSGCSGTLVGGWDGWIALSGAAADSSAYGIIQNPATGAWSGYAWGSDAIGAIGVMSGAGLGALSDLTAGAVSPTVAVASTPATFSATVSNAPSGGSTVSNFTNLFQFDNNADHNTVFTALTDTSPTLTAGGTDVSQVQYTFPTAGTWYVRTCADKSSAVDTGTILESDEWNNCGAWTTVTVESPQLTGTFVASPDTIDPGNPSTLTWTSNATSCVGTGFSTGGAANGSVTVVPTQTSPYQITCTRSGYIPLTLTTTVTVISITASISAKPSCISGGGSSKISWSVLPVSQIQSGSCRLSGPGLSSSPLPVSPDGSAPNASPQTATVPSSSSTYTISCTTTGGAAISKSATVDVTSCWAEF